MNHQLKAVFDSSELLDEEARLDILHQLKILDTPSEAEFDALTRLAAFVSGCKIALISLIDRDRQWFKAKSGLCVEQTSRQDAFCAHAIRENGVMIVPDARDDPRFSRNPLVTGEPNIVFYAGVPIFVQGAVSLKHRPVAIGTLCVIHDEPHEMSSGQLEALKDLAKLVEVMIERHASKLKIAKLIDQGAEHIRQLSIRNRQFRQAERMANMGSWRLTIDDNKTQWSEQVYAIHGLPLGTQHLIEDALDFYPGEARVVISNALKHAIETGQPFEVETDFVTAQGEPRRVRSIGEVELHEGQPASVIGVFQDISQQHALEARLRRSAYNDDLTGLPNRAHFNEYLDCNLEKAAVSGGPLALALLDLDGFKAVNDRCGHLAGDEVLQEFAKKLLSSVPRNSFCARLGGDEFVVVINDPGACGSLKSLLVQLLADLRIKTPYSTGSLDVSATIGAVQWTKQTVNRSELLHRADNALYSAKRAGRGSAKIDGVGGFIKSC